MAVDVVTTVYECPSCGERLLERRCPECNVFCRKLGPGGCCSTQASNGTLVQLLESEGVTHASSRRTAYCVVAQIAQYETSDVEPRWMT